MSMEKRLRKALSQNQELSVKIDTYQERIIRKGGRAKSEAKEGIFINGILVYKISGYVPLRRGLIFHFRLLRPYDGFYVLLLQLADYRTGELYITRKILEVLTGWSKWQIQRALQHLENLGYISYTRSQNQYQITHIVIHRFLDSEECRRINEGSKKNGGVLNEPPKGCGGMSGAEATPFADANNDQAPFLNHSSDPKFLPLKNIKHKKYLIY